jgi:hypothetical protein
MNMPLVNAARDLICNALVGNAITAYNNANAYIGIGDSATAFAVSQTDLQAATNKTRKAMDATYPQLATNVITFRSTFASSDANYTWAEYGVFNASTGGTMLLRNTATMGTKSSGSSWQITITLTITV